MIGSLFEAGIMPNYPEPKFPTAAANEEKEQLKLRQQHYLKQLELFLLLIRRGRGKLRFRVVGHYSGLEERPNHPVGP
jgi:hypothetical protein